MSSNLATPDAPAPHRQVSRHSPARATQWPLGQHAVGQRRTDDLAHRRRTGRGARHDCRTVDAGFDSRAGHILARAARANCARPTARCCWAKSPAYEHYRPSEQLLAEMPADDAARIRASLSGTDGTATRRLMRTGNYDLTSTHFRWIDEALIADETRPEWALAVERLSWGRFYGVPQALLVDGREVATTPLEVWERFQEFHPAVRQRWRERVSPGETRAGRGESSQERGPSGGRGRGTYAWQGIPGARRGSGRAIPFGGLGSSREFAGHDGDRGARRRECPLPNAPARPSTDKRSSCRWIRSSARTLRIG